VLVLLPPLRPPQRWVLPESVSLRSALELTSRIQEKPKEKTIFTVKLEKFDAAAKAKIIREVKALMPNMNLVEVGLYTARYATVGHEWTVC
jgi:ribosomal protein L7/L12